MYEIYLLLFKLIENITIIYLATQTQTALASVILNSKNKQIDEATQTVCMYNQLY